jgi:hypothetical protein
MEPTPPIAGNEFKKNWLHEKRAKFKDYFKNLACEK